jgi:hypothetical protein
MVRCFRPPSTNDEFVGMANYIMGLIHNLLVSVSESIPDSVSSQGSYHLSRECFMADSPTMKKPPRSTLKVSMVGKLPIHSTLMTKSGWSSRMRSLL